MQVNKIIFAHFLSEMDENPLFTLVHLENDAASKKIAAQKVFGEYVASISYDEYLEQFSYHIEVK